MTNDDSPLGYADLNPQQRRKCAYFLGQYNDELKSVKLTLLVNGSGINGYVKVCQKLYLLINDTPEKQRYDDALYGAFKVNEPVTTGKIIGVVSTTRRGLSLQPYITDLSRNCIDDFLRLFIVKPITEKIWRVKSKTQEKYEKEVIIGYIPIFRLKPEQIM